MLTEEARDMLATRRERAVECRRNDQFNDGAARPAESTSVEIGLLHIGEARRDDDARGVVFRRFASGQGGEVWQFRERDIHRKRARLATPVFHPPPESFGQGARINEVEVEELGVDPRGNGCGTDGFTLVRLNADGLTIFDKDLAHPGRKPDLHAARGGGFRHGLGDRAHAADRMAPDAFLAVHLAEAMVQENVARARRVGARIIADDTVEAESGLDRRAFEPTVEEIAGGSREEVEQIPLQVEPESSNSFGYPAGLEKFGDRAEWAALDDIWRRFEHAGTQDVGDGRQASLIIVKTLCIPRREFRDLSFRAAAADLQKASVAQRKEVRDRAVDDPQSMHGKIEVANDFWVQKRNSVRCDRITKAGAELFRNRGASGDGALIEHQYLETGHRQIGGANKTVVATTDDDHIVHHPPFHKP